MWGRQTATELNMSKTFHIFASAWLSVTMEGVTQCCPVPPMDSPNLDRIALFPILSTADTIPTDARVHCLRRCETDSQRHCLASDLHHDFNFKPSCLVELLIGLEMQEKIPLAMFEADRQSLPKVRRGANGKLFWLCGGSAERRVQERKPLKVIWLPKENLLRRLLQRVWGPPGGAKRSVPLSCICT